MQRIRSHPVGGRGLPPAWLALVLAITPAAGQVPGLNELVNAQAPQAEAGAETPESARKRLEQWVRDARDALLRSEGQGAAAGLPAGVEPEELEVRRRDLEQTVLVAMRSLKNIGALQDARNELDNARNEDSAWTGFKDKPPYPLPIIDELLNERDVVADKVATLELSLSNSESMLATTVAETKQAEDHVSNMLVAMQRANGPALDAAKWRVESARVRSRLWAERAAFLQNRCQSLKDHLSAARIRLALIDRKVKTARANSRFNEEDLANIAKTCEARKHALQKEMAGATKRLKAAVASRTQAQAAVDDLTSKGAASDTADLELAKYRLKVADERSEAAQAILEGFEYLIQLENLGFTANQNRHAIVTAANPEERRKALESLSSLRERLWAWENVIDDEVANCNDAVEKLGQADPAAATSDARAKLLDEERGIVAEKLAMLQRLSQAVAYQRKLVKRWDIEYAPPPVEAGFVRNLAQLGTSARDALKKLWSFEIMKFQDKVEVDGRVITGKIPITLGLLLRALLFFMIAYWVASKIAGRLEAGIVKRGHIAHAQARTLRNWMMIVVGFLLAIATLSFLKIPLTVFAFLGGALAIGLGFGTQTLIKNFISGIIVLAERKVRVGDILDVDGIVGTVTEINTRSSVIRSPDEVETMIPNSLFLENRVTNWTLSNRKMRRSLSVGVDYGTPPARVMEILTDCAQRHGLVCSDPAPIATLDNFADSNLVFSLYFWLELKGNTNAMIVASDLRLMIEKRFTEAGIGIPFPQHDVHLKTHGPLQIQLTRDEDTPN